MSKVRIDPDVRRLRAALAATARHNPDSPQVGVLRRQLKAVMLIGRLSAALSEGPDLSAEERAALVKAAKTVRPPAPSEIDPVVQNAVQALVDAAPDLTAKQRDQLFLLLGERS
jgi:hypothetical protein